MLKIERVTVNYLINPEGITGSPQFGWVIGSDRSNVSQKAYRLQIAEDSVFDKLVFDSGILESDQSAHIIPDALALVSSFKYYLRVKTYDEMEESPWSEVFYFISALRSKEWIGQYITAESDSDADNSKGTCVRKSFTIRSEVSSAIIHCTALGLYKLYINGCKAGNDELSPGWTSYKKHLVYQTHDITDWLKNGENVIGAMLGAGWYKGRMGLSRQRNNYGNKAAFLCQLELKYTDGTHETVVTDGSWRGADSPVLFSEIYDGETYDARLEQEGWNGPAFSDTNWRPVKDVLGTLGRQKAGRIHVES